MQSSRAKFIVGLSPGIHHSCVCYEYLEVFLSHGVVPGKVLYWHDNYSNIQRIPHKINSKRTATQNKNMEYTESGVP